MQTLEQQMGVDKHLDHLTKLHINNALGRRYTRIASLLVECLRNLFTYFDEQTPAVMEALIEHVADLQRPWAAPKHKYELRECLKKYMKEQLEEAMKRERHLLHGITTHANAHPISDRP
jgi:isochorismate hydrolase